MWHTKLCRGEDCLLQSKMQRFVVRREDKNGFHSHASFATPGEILLLIVNNPEHCFHEVLLEDTPQKFRIDYDAVPDSSYNVEDEQKFLDTCICAVEEEMSKLGADMNPEKHVRVYSSNSREGDKRSYHVVFDSFYLCASYEAMSLFAKVWKHIAHHKMCKYVDRGVYSRVQGFRFLGCSKPGQERPKKLAVSFRYRGKEVRQRSHDVVLRDFESSMLSFTDNCQPLRLVRVCIPSRPMKGSDEKLMEIYERFKHDERASAFEFWEIANGTVRLKRIAPSYCDGCDSVHEKQNACLYLRGPDVIFNCWRGSTVKVFTAAMQTKCIASAKTSRKPKKVWEGPHLKINNSKRFLKNGVYSYVLDGESVLPPAKTQEEECAPRSQSESKSSEVRPAPSKPQVPSTSNIRSMLSIRDDALQKRPRPSRR